MAQVSSPDRGEVQAFPPRRRLPPLGYLTNGGGIGQDVQGVLQGIKVICGDHDGLAVPVAGDADPLVRGCHPVDDFRQVRLDLGQRHCLAHDHKYDYL
jgi:hypothetical protein